MSFVYVITNEWCPGLSKIGATSNIEARFDNLRSVLPGKSELRWFRNVDDCFVIESLVRQALSDFQIESSIDWLNCPYELVINQFEAIIDNTERDSFSENLVTNSVEKICDISKIGNYCRKTRTKLKITQAQLADLAGVGNRFLSEFENGKATCEIGKVLKVVNTLGIDLFTVKRQDIL